MRKPSSRLLWPSLTVILTLVLSATAFAANSTVPGAITSYTTLESAGFEWHITGDDNNDCTVTVEYRKQGDVTWKNAQPLLRVETGIWTHGEDPGNMLAGSIFWLSPGTAYEARLTLSDPDGGADQQIVTVTTHSIPTADPNGRRLYVTPGSGGGTGTLADPFQGLAAADTAARAGDVFILQPGTYNGKFVPTKNGTANSPIVYIGANPATVILDGGGGTSSTSNNIDLSNRQYIFIESMYLKNCLRPLRMDNTTGVVVRGCTIEPIHQLLSTKGIYGDLVTNVLVADNTLLMPGQWATIGRTSSYGTGGYAILLTGNGIVMCYNKVVESWDALDAGGSDGTTNKTFNVDIYNNLVDRASDDGIQVDAIHQNVRVFRNRLVNVGSTMSCQPCFGGPCYFLYNDIYNTRIEPYKYHQETSYGYTQETSGMIAFQNTSICSRYAWYDSGISRHFKHRNNLLVGGYPNSYSLYLASVTREDMDYNGFNRQGSILYRVNSVSYASPAAFYAGAGQEQHGTDQITINEFAQAAFPANPTYNYSTDGYGPAYAPSDIDLQLVAGSNAIDRGQVLANINDDFTGTAPDLGCYERGKPAPQYGPRPNAAPTAIAGSDVTDGSPALTVNFTGSGIDTDGAVISYSWDFGDGVGTSTQQNPTYVYDFTGTYTATLTVTDNDGATGQDTVDITVSGNSRPTALASSDVTSGEAALKVFFRGSGTDVDGTVVSYHWTFGDGASSDEQNPSHTYTNAGDYTATLTVTDDGGATGQDTLAIHVTALAAAEGIVDNKDTSAVKTFRTISGNWTTSTAGTNIWNPAALAPSYRRQSVRSGAENARAEWTSKSLPAGEYEVFAWWPNTASIMGANVAYEIYHAAGMTSVRVNQRLNGGTWVSLGRYSFAPGAHKVQIHNGQSGPGQYIAADAVRFVRVGSAKVAAVDNKDNGGGKGFQVVSGKWSSGSGTNVWDPADPKASYVRTTTQAGAETARAEWMCSYLPGGVCEVFAWWPKGTGMGQNVAYVVWHAGGTTTVRVNQSVGSGTWVSLGTYNFAPGAHKVQIHNGQSAPGSFVAADAVKFVRQ